MDGNTQPLLAYNVWMSLSRETRITLAQLFSIPRTGEVVVRSGMMINGNISGEVTSDGYRPQDLYAITIEKMQTLTGSPVEDFYKLFDDVCGIVKNFTLEDIHAGKHFIQTTRGLEVAPQEVEVIIEEEIAEEVLDEAIEHIAPERDLSWQDFIKSHKGPGISMTDLGRMYKEYKHGRKD